MDFLYISPEVNVLFEDNERLRFLKKSIKSPTKISEEKLQKKIIEMELSNAFYRHQDNEISRLKKILEISADGVINKIPKNCIIDTFEDVMILKIGSTELLPGLIDLTKKVGVVGYWDNANLIICVSRQYESLFENIKKIFICNQVKITINTDFWGPNLKIIAM